MNKKNIINCALFCEQFIFIRLKNTGKYIFIWPLLRILLYSSVFFVMGEKKFSLRKQIFQYST